MDYSIVIPCYKSEESLFTAVELIQEFFRERQKEIQVILVNDGSPDTGETFRKISKIASQYTNVIGVDLAKNTGQHNATLCALNYAEGDYIISMDDDMQTHPSQLPKLLDEIEKGYDVVYAYYPEKKHGLFRNLGSKFNSWSVRMMIGKPKELKTSSFWVIRKFVRDDVIKYGNPYSYIQGLFLRTTSNISCVPVEHYERQEGTSGYTLKSLIKLWSNIMGFSVVPLRMASVIGAMFSGGAIVAALVILLKKLIVGSVATGWTSLMVALCFFSGVILLFLGLIGEYVGRMFLASNKEPQFIVREIVGQGK